MQLHKLTRSKIEKFFHSNESETLMGEAAKIYESNLDKIHQNFMYKFRDYLVDEYSLFFEECVSDAVDREIRALLLGDERILARYNLAPTNWGLTCDHYGVRRKIVEANQDIIGSTYIQSLEEQLARMQEEIEIYRNR